MSEARILGDGSSPASAGNVLNVPVGYRRTEAGVIPKDWEKKTVREIAPLQRGFDLPVAGIRTGPHPVVYSNGILRHHNRAIAKAPGVVTGRSGTIGKVHFVAKDYWPHNTALWVVSYRGNHPKFVYYLYSHLDLARFLSGSGVPTLNRNDVHQHLTSLPPLPEQRAIAAVLSDVDDLIGSLEALIAKKRAIKQAAMQELLTGRTRLPGFGGRLKTGGVMGEGPVVGDAYAPKGAGYPPDVPAGYKRTEVGVIPEDWAVARLRDCSEIVMGQSPPGSSYNRSGVGTALINGPTEFTGLHPVKIQWTTQPSRICKHGDLLICVRGSSTGRTNYADGTYAIGRGVAAMRAKADSDTQYLSYQVILGVSKLLDAATGSTFPSVDGTSLSNALILSPPLPEQRAIATILSDMDSEIAALERRLDKTRAIKQGMMQQLLTGAIRLPIPSVDGKADP